MVKEHLSLRILLGASLAAIALGCGSKQSTSSGAGPGAPPPPTQDAPAPAAGDPVFPDEPFRAQKPAAGEPRPFQLPEIKKFQIGPRDKIDVYLVERHELPTVSMELEFDGGAMTDPRSKAGLASVCMDMMSEGTTRLDKIAFNEALADVASSVNAYAGDDTQGVWMSSLTKSFDQTFALFIETITSPGFRKADFDRMIERRIEQLKQVKGSPASIAERLTGVVLYGANHPLGRVPTEKSYRAIRLSDCKAYHRRWVKPRGARLFVVGDMTEEQIRKAFEPVLARWRGAPPRLVPPPKPRPAKGVRVYFVNVPGAAQSVVALAHIGPKRKAPDYFATQLAGQVLGGSFSSRINMNLREDKGYSYGARASFTYSRWFGFLLAHSSVRADSTYQTALEMLREVRDLDTGTRPPTPAEVAREKEGTILALPGRFATAASALSQYQRLVYHGLPLDYWNDYVENVSAVTPEQVAEAAKAHLRPEEAVLLIVGDAKAPQVVRADGSEKDEPLMVGDARVQLTAALEKLAPALGDERLTIAFLDADGKVLERRAVKAPGKAQPERASAGAKKKKAAPEKATPVEAGASPATP